MQVENRQCQVIVYIAMSLDGYIAKPNDDLEFLSMVEKEGEDYGYQDFINGIDTVVMGRRTYDWIMRQVPEFPHQDKKTYVLTRTSRSAVGKTEFYTGDWTVLIDALKKQGGGPVFVDGGAEVVHGMLKADLIDELILSIVPILLGDGIRLFTEGRPEQILELIDVKRFDTDLVQLHYRKKGAC